MDKRFEINQYQGVLAAGGQETVPCLEFFALVSGSGLTFAPAGRGTFVDLQVFFLYGDENGALGNITVRNPTGSPVTYKIQTSTRAFSPNAQANAQNVAITSCAVTIGTTALATGAAADGANASGNPVLVAGSDGTKARSLRTTTGGVARTAPEASTLGGASRFRLSAAGTTNLTSVKGTPGKVYGYTISNPSAAVRYLKLYDKASAPVLASDVPVATVLIPAGQTINADFAVGEDFSLGIALAMTQLPADTDATALVAGDLLLTLRYA